MKIRKAHALFALVFSAVLLTGCDGNTTEQTSETTPTETQAVTEAYRIPEYIVEPNAIEGIPTVQTIIPLGKSFLLVGLNEHEGRAVALYDPQNGSVKPITLSRLSETTDILKVVTDETGNIHIFYSGDAEGGGRYVETYDSQMNLIEEQEVTSLTAEAVDHPTMQIDKDGNHYFFGWDESGNHEVVIYDKDMQLLGSVRGEMTIGDDLITGADGKVYLMYHVGVYEARFACVDPVNLTIKDIVAEEMPTSYTELLPGANGYDFYMYAQEALYGIYAAEGTSEVVIDWKTTVFNVMEIRGIAAMSDGSFLVSNTGDYGMDSGTWKMVAQS